MSRGKGDGHGGSKRDHARRGRPAAGRSGGAANRDAPAPSPGDARDSRSGSKPPASIGPTSTSAREIIRRRPASTDVLGLEIAGEVAALGPDARVHRLGARVTALVPGGGYADYCVAHETNALPIPAGLSAIEAAAIPETYFTVWTNVFSRGALKAGETLLVHGGTSGIGTTAIALAKAFGARVVATAGSDEKAAQCERLGADLGVNYRKDDFVAPTREATRRPGRRRHSRHGRRRLRRAQLCGRGARRTHRADRVPHGAKGDGGSAAAHGEAPHPYRLDASSPLAGGERRSSPRPCGPRCGRSSKRAAACRSSTRFSRSPRRRRRMSGSRAPSTSARWF